MWQHFKVGYFCTFAFYFGNEDHMGVSEALCLQSIRGTEEKTKKEALLNVSLQLENGSNQRDGRRVCEIISSPFFSMFANLNVFPCANDFSQGK